MRIAIVRGLNLNKWELQSYEPLMQSHELVAFTDTRHKFDLSSIEIPIRKLPYNKELAGLYYLVGLEEELKGMDICFTSDTVYAYSYQAVKAKEKYGVKLVVHVAENIPFNYEKNPMNRGLKIFREQIRKEVREKADFFITLSTGAREALLMEGVSPSKVKVIPWGVDIGRFRPRQKPPYEVMKQFGVDEDEVVILYIGRLDWARGVYDALFAAKLLLNDRDMGGWRFKFLFVGAGEEKEGLKWLAKKLEISDWVRFHPSILYPEIHTLYDLSDIFILPSIPRRYLKEQFGLVLVEAMASGKPVVSTMCGAIPEVVGDAGILVQPNDFPSLYREIKRLIMDEELRKELGRRGRRRAEEFFDAEKVAHQIEEVFLKVL
jgi:glycosyltransferase involved in cell wall biosynthesis